MSNKRDIRAEMMEVSGENFREWYDSLSKEEKLEYAFIIESLKNTTAPNGLNGEQQNNE